MNGSQLYTTNQAVAGNTTAISTLSTGIASGTVGLVRQQGGAPGNGTITIGAATGGSAVDVTGTAGARQVKGVAAGVSATDAVNVGQLNAVGTIAGNSVQYDDATRARVTLGGTAAVAPVTLSNVAAGAVAATSTDAVNGSQLYTTNQAVAGNTTAISALSTGIASGTVGLVQQQGGAPGNGTITIGAATGGSAVDVTGAAGARQVKGVAAGVSATDAVNVGQLNAAVSSVSDNAVMYDNAARSMVTLGGVGASIPVVVRNVAPATLSSTSTDAVNGSQLYATNLAVTANTNAINALSNNLSNVQDGLIHAQQPVVQPTSTPGYLKYFAASSNGAAASASGPESVAAGGNSSASGPNSVAVGSGAQASGSGAVALGANSVVRGNGSVAIGEGSVASSDNTVSFGNSATGVTRTLANVSAGVAPTDAVNVKQLNDSMSGLRSQIEHDRADANGGTASAVAIASLPQAPAPGKSVVAVGGGTYAGQSALAVGLSTYAGRWILKASGSTNTRGTVAAGVGAGFVW
ncbi:Peptide transport system permease protein SapB (plasmid) [Burkholderia sp. KJ006]|nr:Peptide transport system permease protein SapB [Burkholderia sp. KJ006]